MLGAHSLSVLFSSAGSVFFWGKHDDHPPGWPTWCWHRASGTETETLTARAEPRRWLDFKRRTSLTQVLEARLMKHPLKFPFWIIYLRFPTRAVGTSTLWQPHHVFLEILQRAFQLLRFPPGPSPGKRDTKLSCKRLSNRGASIKHHFPYLADSDLTEGLFLHPSCKGVSFSFKAIAQ